MQPQVEVKSFPAEPILPLAANSEGTYIVGGGVSGEIYLWEVNFFCIVCLLVHLDKEGEKRIFPFGCYKLM